MQASDAAAWAQLRTALWPDGAEDHPREIGLFFAGRLKETDAAFIAEDAAGKAIAILELAIRTDIPGIEGKRTCYVEGIYVIPERRHQGIARELLHASLDWAREKGCVALASDRADRIVIHKGFK
jgi:aminoglycoside 6'-N-acetyltransferase I